MNQTLGTAWACPYCEKSFVSAAARIAHLQEGHDERPDSASASLAVQQLHEQLKRLSAKHGKLPERKSS